MKALLIQLGTGLVFCVLCVNSVLASTDQDCGIHKVLGIQIAGQDRDDGNSFGFKSDNGTFYAANRNRNLNDGANGMAKFNLLVTAYLTGESVHIWSHWRNCNSGHTFSRVRIGE